MDKFEKAINILSEKLLQDDYAKAFYAALCNVQWLHFTKKSEDEAYGCTWRYAGGLIAEMRDCGESYIDFYCSGNEGRVRKDVYDDLNRLGYRPIPYVLGDEIPVGIEIYS